MHFPTNPHPRRSSAAAILSSSFKRFPDGKRMDNASPTQSRTYPIHHHGSPELCLAHHQASFSRSHSYQMAPFQLVRGKTQLSQTRMPLLIIVPAQSASGLDTRTIRQPWVPWNTRTHSIQLYVPYIPPLPCLLSDFSKGISRPIFKPRIRWCPPNGRRWFCELPNTSVVRCSSSSGMYPEPLFLAPD